MLINEPFSLLDIETEADRRHVRVVRLLDRFGVVGAFNFRNRLRFAHDRGIESYSEASPIPAAFGQGPRLTGRDRRSRGPAIA